MNHYLKIENVVVPKEIHDKLEIISKHDHIPIEQLSSQAIQEWIGINFGTRYPSNS
tara:strand:+ start:5040 stop:5207 length:168 start_codon:yes stop_codon:yes gene_type:complete